MPTSRLLITLLAGLPLACTSSPGTTTGDASTGTAAESTAAESTAAESTAAESTAAEGTESHGTQATHDEPTTSTHASTTEHTTGSTGHHGSDATGDTHGETAATTGELSPVDAYCACMLEQCHDQYHGTWGEEHESSEAMCVAAAEALPSVGMPATMGNSLECRQYYCELGEAEPGACDSAIGGGACV